MAETADIAATDSSPFELHAGALRLAVRPDLGGCIAGFWHRDTPILRSTEPAALASSRRAGCYPLAPYANRLGYRRFRWRGRDHATRANFDDSPHSLHGVAWQRPWTIESSSAQELVLHLAHHGDADWPFAFELRQYFALTPRSLALQMVLVNADAAEQPAGLGWHPYFPKRARSRLHAEVAQRWDNDATGLPVSRHAQPGLDGDVAHMAFDNCFDGWRGAARIRDEKFSLQLASSLGRLVVYTPQDKDYFCVEPVGHVPNAVHMADPAAHGLRALAPGESLQASMTLEVTVL
jgi:aldose 1-epimerase